MIDFDSIFADPSFKIYGWSIKDILNVQRWLMSNNVTLEDLSCSAVFKHHWEAERIKDLVMEGK